MRPQAAPRSGLTLVEALVTGLVIAATLPMLLESGSTIVRMDRSRQQRAQAANIGRVVMEGIHYDLYNGSTPGYGPADSAEIRRAKYGAQSYLEPLLALAETESSVTRSGSGRASRYLTRLFNRVAPGSGGDPGVQSGIDTREHPSLATELKDFRVTVEVRPHLDVPASTTDPLASKEPESPKVDLAWVKVTVSWQGPHGGRASRDLETRVTRPVLELDPTLSRGGR